MLIFQGFERILEGYFDDFSVTRMGKNGVKQTFCRTHYRTRKWRIRCENIRYALSGFRLLVLKCKLPPYYIKTYYNSTVLQYLFVVSSKILYTCNISSLLFCQCKILYTFPGSVSSGYRIHSIFSKVVHHPKNNPVFTPNVVTHPKFTPKNILKVVNTYQTSNTIPSQICPYHKYTSLSTTHKQKYKTVHATRTHISDQNTA